MLGWRSASLLAVLTAPANAASPPAAPIAEVRSALTLPRWTLDAALLLTLGVLALALRLPYLQLIPAFTDELRDIQHAFQITQGELRPLTGTSAYLGSLWEWLLAGALLASGFSPYTPRALVLAFGVLTVLATYPLGRAWGGRAAGALAGTLLATSAGHVVLNSHVAWSACITPLFVTLGAWALDRAVRGTATRPRAALLLAGLCWGLALQTHPAVLALLPGAAVYLLWRGRALLRSRWLIGAAALFGLANFNLLLYNLSSGFGSISRGLAGSPYYSNRAELSLGAYLAGLGQLLLMLVRLLTGTLENFGNISVAFLQDLRLWPITLLAIGGVVWQWRRGNALPGLLLLSMIVILPLFNANYGYLLRGRYVMPLLPILYSAVAAMVVASFERLHRSALRWRQRSFAPALLGQACLGLLLTFVVVQPVLNLYSHYEEAWDHGGSNAPIFETFEQIKRHGRDGDVVIIDGLLDYWNYREENRWRVASIFRILLDIDGTPYRMVDLGRTSELAEPRSRCHDQLVIVGSRDLNANREIIAKLQLRDLDRRPATPQTRPGRYRLYRLDRLPGAPATC